jgi:hypothetical protein
MSKQIKHSIKTAKVNTNEQVKLEFNDDDLDEDGN